MAPRRRHTAVKSRKDVFSDKTQTKIWCEKPSKDNPYITSQAFCHGYDIVGLMKKRSFVDVLYLLFRAELPSAEDKQLLESLMISLINPGPRHPATRAAMTAGVGKTNPVHILPIGTTVLGGTLGGAGAIEATMRYFIKNMNKPAGDVIANFLMSQPPQNQHGDLENIGMPSVLVTEKIPGMGRRYGGVDSLTQSIANELCNFTSAGKALRWGQALNHALSPYNCGWIITGLAAATFVDLGFQPRSGGGLFQCFSSPGLLAHGLELANKPIHAMPFVEDENYVFE